MKIRKNLKNILLAMGIIASLGTYTAYAVTANGTASVTLYTPLTVSAGAAMSFGSVGADGAGTINVSTAGAITCSGSGTFSCPATGSQGVFNISGANNAVVRISYVSAILKNSGGTSIALTPGGATAITLNATGTGILNVAGILVLNGNEPAGSYSTANSGGSPYTVTVNY